MSYTKWYDINKYFSNIMYFPIFCIDEEIKVNSTNKTTALLNWILVYFMISVGVLIITGVVAVAIITTIKLYLPCK